MRQKVIYVGILLSIIPVFINHAQQDDFPVLKGSYLGQKPPGMTPEIFAPGIVSSEHQERSSLSISSDGREIWWSRWRLPHDLDKYPQIIMFIRDENGEWQDAIDMGTHFANTRFPSVSPDGKYLFFTK